MSSSNGDDDTVEIPMLREHEFVDDQVMADEKMPSPNDLDYLSAPERAWLLWFYALSVEEKRVVEICAKRGIAVNATNIARMKRIVKSHEAPNSDPDR